MRIRTGTCNFTPVEMEKGTYFTMLKDDGRIEWFVTLFQIDLSSLARKRNISNTLFLGTDIYNRAATISIMHKVDKSTSRRSSDTMKICSDHLLILWHDVMLLPSVCLLNANLKGNGLLLFVGNATHTTVTIHYNAIMTHILSWWYETENKNNHYHNPCANYLPLSKDLWITYCIILKFRKL